MQNTTEQPEPQDSPTPPSIPGLEGPSTPEQCMREYEAAADRRANGQH